MNDIIIWDGQEEYTIVYGGMRAFVINKDVLKKSRIDSDDITTISRLEIDIPWMDKNCKRVLATDLPEFLSEGIKVRA